MESHRRHLHSFQQQHQQQLVVDPSTTAGDGRFPQWSLQETKQFLGIRAELDQSFMETKRNKLLWEVISTRMKDKGFNRSPEQCKCKWKNLVTRYKGCETMEPEAMRQQFPFYNELQAIFAARMQRMVWSEAEGCKKKLVGLSSDEELDQDNDIESEGLDHQQQQHHKASAAAAAAGSSNKKLKRPSSSSSGKGSGGNGAATEVKEMLDEFMRQQMQIEIQWREAAEVRESERRMKEMEWRHKMEALENERVMMERRWREREEQRRMREEARAEKRDALITTLLNTIRTTSSSSSSRDHQDPHHHNHNHI